MSGSAIAQEVQDDLVTGAADLEWDTESQLKDRRRAHPPRGTREYGVFPQAGTIAPL